METPTPYTYNKPDPSWDYAEVYDSIESIKGDLDAFTAWLSQHEDASKATDIQAKLKLETIISSLTELRDLF
jgi:hypothetical protein